MDTFKSKYGPWAIVAGASEGLGAAFAEALARRGINLILLARRKDKLQELKSYLISSYSINVQTYSVDLSNFEQVEKLYTQIDLPVGLLIYNAAYAPINYFEDVSAAQLEQVVQVNVKGPLLFSKLVSQKMMEQQRGGIILMSSLSGTHGSPKIATYAASKAFNTTLAEGLWLELKQHGIDVMASVAGAILTPGYQQAQQKKAPGTMTPENVAEHTLNALGKGPVTVPGFLNKIGRWLMGRVLPAKTAIRMMNNQTKNIS